MGEPDASVQVRYLQTPLAFVDIRRSLNGSCQGDLAFAGIASVTEQVVRWHACLNFVPPVFDPEKTWADTLAGHPPPTTDEGLFECISEISQTYLETALDSSYKEIWRKVSHGDGIFLAVRRGVSLLVVVGDYFHFASDERKRGLGGLCEYAGGRVSRGWLIDLSIGGGEGELCLPGKPEEFKVLPGSTVPWPLPSLPHFEG